MMTITDYDRTIEHIKDEDVDKPMTCGDDWNISTEVEKNDIILKIFKNSVTGYYIAVDSDGNKVIIARDNDTMIERMEKFIERN